MILVISQQKPIIDDRNPFFPRLNDVKSQWHGTQRPRAPKSLGYGIL
jgi:hypothetical protein